MPTRSEIRTTFEPTKVIQPIYTGGAVSLSEDGRLFAGTLGEHALLTDFNTGACLARIEGDGEVLTTLMLSPDARYLIVCSRSLAMRIYSVQSDDDITVQTKLLRTLKPHTAPVIALAIDSSSSLLATGGADGVVKVWDLRAGYVTHTFGGHSGVISALHFFHAEASDEGEVTKSRNRKRKNRRKSEDLAQQGGATQGFKLASGGEDGKVKIWDLHERKSIATLDGHASVVRSLDYSPELRILLSSSRDRTTILWDSRTWKAASTVPAMEEVESAGFVNNGALFFTAGETGRIRIWDAATGGEVTEDQSAGLETDAVVDVQLNQRLNSLISVHADQTLALHSLEPLAAYSRNGSAQLSALPILRKISGTHDEVIDMAFVGSQRDYMALATNVEDIRIISLDTSAGSGTGYFGADVASLSGHEDIIITLSIDWSGHWLATGAKDNMAKLWRLDPGNSSYTCYATFTGHAESIGAVALPSSSPSAGSKEYNNPLSQPPTFLITGSQDRTVKKWDVPAQEGRGSRAAYTRKAHDKDINAIATSYSSISPLFASASQDRTVKIWDLDSGEAIGVLRGHKRGVWSVAFSPPGTPALTSTATGGGASGAKGMIVTGSGDKTVRIWSLSDYSCLRTFEGHANSVLKVVWLPSPEKPGGPGRKGLQVASAAGDGLVKVWDGQEGECAATLDNHLDRVWALAVKPNAILSLAEQNRREAVRADAEVADEDDHRESSPSVTLVSGSADSTITFWSDTTESTAVEATTRATARIEQDQKLENYIRAANYREAIVLALQLNHPRRLLDLFTSVLQQHERGSFTGSCAVDEVLKSLSDYQLWSLLRRIRDWNANGRTHAVAQQVLYAVLRLHSKERLLNLRRSRASRNGGNIDAELSNAVAELSVQDKSNESIKVVLDGLRAYTERHYGRLEKQAEERFVLGWALEQMNAVGGDQLDGMTNGGLNGHDVLMLDDGT